MLKVLVTRGRERERSNNIHVPVAETSNERKCNATVDANNIRFEDHIYRTGASAGIYIE